MLFIVCPETKPAVCPCCPNRRLYRLSLSLYPAGFHHDLSLTTDPKMPPLISPLGWPQIGPQIPRHSVEKEVLHRGCTRSSEGRKKKALNPFRKSSAYVVSPCYRSHEWESLLCVLNAVALPCLITQARPCHPPGPVL